MLAVRSGVHYAAVAQGLGKGGGGAVVSLKYRAVGFRFILPGRVFSFTGSPTPSRKNHKIQSQSLFIFPSCMSLHQLKPLIKRYTYVQREYKTSLVVAVAWQADKRLRGAEIDKVHLRHPRLLHHLALHGRLPLGVRVPALPEQQIRAALPRLVVCRVLQQAPAHSKQSVTRVSGD